MGEVRQCEGADETDEGEMDADDAPAGEMPEDSEMGEADEASESRRPPQHGTLEHRGCAGEPVGSIANRYPHRGTPSSDLVRPQ